MAEKGKISEEAMKLEVGKAYKRRISREKRKQEQIDLAPARNLQPKVRTIRYDNIHSAMAEEGVIAMAMQESALLDLCGGLTEGEFSVPLLGKVYGQMLHRHSHGLDVSLGAIEDLSAEEMSHLASVVQKQQGTVSETAFRDCVAIIRKEAQKKGVTSDDDLLALQRKLRESKGTNQ